jgi:hypothetical protein
MKKRILFVILACVLLSSCMKKSSSPEMLPPIPTVVISPVKTEVYCPEVTLANGLTISANKVSQQGKLDIQYGGLTLVKVKLINAGKETVTVSPEQFTGMLGSEEILPYVELDAYRMLYDSFVKSRAEQASAGGALWGAIGGALMGAAMANIFNTDMSPVVKAGALSGATGGMATSYIQAKAELEKSLEAELGARSLTDKPLYSGARRQGLLFFPAGVLKLRYHLGADVYEITF